MRIFFDLFTYFSSFHRSSISAINSDERTIIQLSTTHQSAELLRVHFFSNHIYHITSSYTMSGKIIIDSALRTAVNLQSSKLPSEVAKTSAALLSSLSGTKHALPDLAYDYNALEPVISAETMEIHHSKHHNTYVTNLNATIEKIDSAMIAGDVSGTIALQGALKFNGGGHLNHCLFWENLSPNSSGITSGGALEAAIKERFGSVDAMKEEMGATTVAIQGSGWGWLGYNKKTGKLDIATCANQDPLEATTGLKPLLGIDVWEHAYYVDYRNVRPSYVKAVWEIVNWEVVEGRLAAAK